MCSKAAPPPPRQNTMLKHYAKNKKAISGMGVLWIVFLRAATTPHGRPICRSLIQPAFPATVVCALSALQSTPARCSLSSGSWQLALPAAANLPKFRLRLSCACLTYNASSSVAFLPKFFCGPPSSSTIHSRIMLRALQPHQTSACAS